MGVLSDIIKEYYTKRGLVWPNFDNAMKFVATEIGEVYEIDLARNTWVRNNPEDKPKFNKEDLAKELGDVLMMVMVAGIVEDVDPLEALLDKMYKKTDHREVLVKLEEPDFKTASISNKNTTIFQAELNFGNTLD